MVRGAMTILEENGQRQPVTIRCGDEYDAERARTRETLRDGPQRR